MRSPKQTEASRANGAKSKGPITPQGKRNSSRNATRHGLLAETIVLEAELAGRFLELLDSLIEEHQPRTPTETMLVDTIAAARWRQDRIWGMQKVAFDHDIASCDSAEESSPLRAVLTLRASAESARTHELLLRYEIALDRQISRALLRLQQLQARELKPTEDAPAERTQQPVETVTTPLPAAAQIPHNPVPQNRPPAPNPPSPIPPRAEKAISQPRAARNPGPPSRKPAA